MKNQDLLFVAKQATAINRTFVDITARYDFEKRAIGIGDVAETVGYMTPGVGSVLSGRDAYKAFGQGRIGAGLGHAALAGIGLIPGAGMLGGAVKGLGGLALRGGSKLLARGAGQGVAKVLPTAVGAAKGVASGVKGVGGSIQNVAARNMGPISRAGQTGTGRVATIGGQMALGSADASHAAGVARDTSNMSNLQDLGAASQQTISNPLTAQPMTGLG